MASSAPDQRSEGSKSPAARASTGVTFSIPSFESIGFNSHLHLGKFHRASNGNVTKPGGQNGGRRSLTKIILTLSQLVSP